jgi:ketosteroid isomerase-like protein
MKKSTEKLTSAAASSIDVRVYGGGTVAVDIGDYKQVGQDKNGKPFDRLSRFTNVWILKDQQWQCVSGHASNVPPKP